MPISVNGAQNTMIPVRDNVLECIDIVGEPGNHTACAFRMEEVQALFLNMRKECNAQVVQYPHAQHVEMIPTIEAPQIDNADNQSQYDEMGNLIGAALPESAQSRS